MNDTSSLLQVREINSDTEEKVQSLEYQTVSETINTEKSKLVMELNDRNNIEICKVSLVPNYKIVNAGYEDYIFYEKVKYTIDEFLENQQKEIESLTEDNRLLEDYLSNEHKEINKDILALQKKIDKLEKWHLNKFILVINYDDEESVKAIKEKDMKKENHEIERIRKESLHLKQKNKLLKQENVRLRQKNKRVMNDCLLLKQENDRVRKESFLLREESLLLKQENDYLHLKKENDQNFTNSEHSSDIVKNKRKRRMLSDLEIRRLLNILNPIDPLLAYKWRQIFNSESDIEIIESRIKYLDKFIHKQLIPELKKETEYLSKVLKDNSVGEKIDKMMIEIYE
ncbi:4303_t:CDS:2, partial [Racocetra fulgida]